MHVEVGTEAFFDWKIPRSMFHCLCHFTRSLYYVAHILNVIAFNEILLVMCCIQIKLRQFTIFVLFISKSISCYISQVSTIFKQFKVNKSKGKSYSIMWQGIGILFQIMC